MVINEEYSEKLSLIMVPPCILADADEELLMHQKRVKFTETKSVVTLTVDSLPAKAAIDPRHILIDRVFNDNIKTVKLD